MSSSNTLGNATTVMNGLIGDVYYLDHPVNGKPSPVPKFTSDYLAGVHLPDPVYFKDLYRPEGPWTDGFVDVNGKKLQDLQGNDLVEYFSIVFQSTLRLPVGYPPGLYEIGMITDDGGILSLDTGSGMKPFIDQDFVHATQMACASKALFFDSTTAYPMKLSYMQGHRWDITLALVWRRVPDKSSSSLASISNVPIYAWADHSIMLIANPDDCSIDYSSQSYPQGATNPGYISFWRTLDVAPVARFDDMLTRGWEVIPPAAFWLPNGKTNPCP